MMQKISIIVPVYNTEEQIDKCLQSIINQDDKNIEVIIINDGSTDNSEEKLLKYVEEYKDTIFYYKKENTGVADSRNFGIEKSTGDYILFVDSDDYIDKDLIKNLRKQIDTNPDIVKFKANFVTDGAITKEEGPSFSKTAGENAFNQLAFSDIMFDAVCLYLFKKDLFIKNNFYFKTGTYHEDFGLIPLMVLNASSVISIDYYGYYYVQTKNSITRNNDYKKTLKRFEDTLLHYDNMLKFIETANISKLSKENVKIYYTNGVLLKLKDIRKEDRKPYIIQIKQRKMTKNIKVRNIKQLIKKALLTININWYLKLKK